MSSQPSKSSAERAQRLQRLRSAPGVPGVFGDSTNSRSSSSLEAPWERARDLVDFVEPNRQADDVVLKTDDRFLSDIARLSQGEPDRDPAKHKAAPDAEDRSGGAKKPAATAHPSGERSSKRQSALAENLKKWLGARKSGDDGS